MTDISHLFDNDQQWREHAASLRASHGQEARCWKRVLAVAVLALVLLAVSCAPGVPPVPAKVPQPVKIRPVKKKVLVVGKRNAEMGRQLAVAIRETELARKEAGDARRLVERMDAAKDPFLKDVAGLRAGYEERVDRLSSSLMEAERTLTRQQADIDEAEELLDNALVAKAKAEQNEKALVLQNRMLGKKARKGEKYKHHWDTRHGRMLRTVGWSVGVTLAVVVALFVWQWFSNPMNITKKLARGLLFNSRNALS